MRDARKSLDIKAQRRALLAYPATALLVVILAEAAHLAAPAALQAVARFFAMNALDVFWLNIDADLAYIERLRPNRLNVHYVSILAITWAALGILLLRLFWSAWRSDLLPITPGITRKQATIVLLVTLVFALITFWLAFWIGPDAGTRRGIGLFSIPLGAYGPGFILIDLAVIILTVFLLELALRFARKVILPG